MFSRLKIRWPDLPEGETYLNRVVKAVNDWTQDIGQKGSLYDLGDAGTVTGTPTSGTGAFTTASYTLNWTALGDRLLYNGSVVITTNNTAATSIVVPLPTGYIPKENTDGTGCDDSTRVQMVVKVGASAKALAVVKYDGTYPGADGVTLIFSGHFRF